MKDLFPNKFYKKIWFYLFIFGFALSLIAVLAYLYMDDVLNTTNVYVLAGAGFGVVIFAAIVSFFSFKTPDPTLKSFSGEDLGITRGDLTLMKEPELRRTFSRVTGVPVQNLP